MTDVEQVGGKNASLGEMIGQLGGAGIRVPGGFATTAAAFREFLADSDLAGAIAARLCAPRRRGRRRAWRRRAPRFAAGWRNAVARPRLSGRSAAAYEALSKDAGDVSFAVRSSATAEDLPDASFAGQQETFLNIKGLDNILHAIKEVFASLYNDRAIAYRVHKGFAHADVALSAGVQRMVRSDLGAAGVMFTMDTESGFDQVVFITAVVRSRRDRWCRARSTPTSSTSTSRTSRRDVPRSCARASAPRRSRWCSPKRRPPARRPRVVEVPRGGAASASRSPMPRPRSSRATRVAIEKHYGRPMDIEWGRDGIDGKLYILQARPETVKSREDGGDAAPLPAEGGVEGARERARHRPEDRAGAGAAGRVRRRDG